MKGFLLLISVVLICFSPLASSAKPDHATLSRLVEGEIVLMDSRSDQAGGAARVLVLAQAPAKSFWDVILSCEKAFVFVDGLQSCEVLEDTGDRALVHQLVKKGWPIPTQDFIFESLREPYREIHFRLVEGNLKAMEGRWLFEDIPEGLLVDYEVRIQPGIPAPGFLVRRNIQKDMPDLLACIRGLAEGSGSVERERDDLDRCPGDPGKPD
jgi:hypothetical protein